MQKKAFFHYFLFPFSGIYWVIAKIRNLLFDFGFLSETEFDIPIISVGNITVGGTGKTPHIEYLAGILKSEYRVAVLSRGYKRKTKGFVLGSESSDAESLGDEPFQIKSKFPEIVVAVDENRKRGIKQLLEIKPEIDIVLLDDAYQHRYVKPGISILLIDYNRPILKDYLLPFGRLREPASGKLRANIILISKSPEDLSPIERRLFVKNLQLTNLQYLYFTTVKPGDLKPVFKDSKADPEEILNQKPGILVVSGIANPASLIRFVKHYSGDYKELHFPDHHDFTDGDILKIQTVFEKIPSPEKIIITTEKDAVRLQKFSDLPEIFKSRMFFIPVSIDFLNDDKEQFNSHITNYVRNNKRNSILHKGKN